MSADKFIDALIGLFGLGRASVGEWPERALVDEYVRLIKDAGGVIAGSSGSPDGSFDIVRFRIRGRRVRLCIEEFGEVTLWGPRRLVAELAARVAAEGLSSSRFRSKSERLQSAD
jgi:hypothetical protein